MKALLLLGFLIYVFSCNVVSGDEELANKLKPFEQYSPYKWTKWLEMRPPQTGVAAAVAYTQPAGPSYKASEDEDDDDLDLESEESPEEEDSMDGWFKRAVLSEEKDEKKSKKKSKSKSTLETETTATKPSIVPLGFWAPPPTSTPNETVLLPPGYWAAKKSMFVAKLFEALAASVLNSTGPPTEEITTTTLSPQAAILNELQSVLLSDVARSLPSTSDESEESTAEEDESEEESEEQTTTKMPATKKVKTKVTTTPVPTTPAPTTTTVDPVLLGKLEFLSKLSEAIANQQYKLSTEPLTTTTEAPVKGKGKKGSKAKKGKKEKGPTTPKWMKFVPTTTTTPPPPTINYDALAKILLGEQ